MAKQGRPWHELGAWAQAYWRIRLAAAVLARGWFVHHYRYEVQHDVDAEYHASMGGLVDEA